MPGMYTPTQNINKRESEISIVHSPHKTYSGTSFTNFIRFNNPKIGVCHLAMIVFDVQVAFVFFTLAKCLHKVTLVVKVGTFHVQ